LFERRGRDSPQKSEPHASLTYVKLNENVWGPWPRTAAARTATPLVEPTNAGPKPPATESVSWRARSIGLLNTTPKTTGQFWEVLTLAARADPGFRTSAVPPEN
jgi:hypothetical protein